MKFEWDPGKNSSNREKHGCDLAEAPEIFDHDRFEMRDERKDYGENRFIVIGLSNNRIMVAVFTTRGTDTVRIISLRKANNGEKERFERASARRLDPG